jgi:F-type H+-transporting ATPase subunit b
MPSTLDSLLNLLIASIPTIVLFAFLTIYLDVVLFRPIGKILQERKESTDGVRELAQRAYDAAKQKTEEYDRALDAARAALHEECEKSRLQWLEEQARAIAGARTEIERQIRDTRTQVSCEMEQAQPALNSVAESLSESVVNALLERRAA